MFGILCFGDSITAGRGEYPGTGWVGRLKDVVETDECRGVYNLGIPGDTTTKLLKRMDIECRARIQLLRPGDSFVILVAIGINDSQLLLSNRPARPLISEITFQRNLERIITRARKYEARVSFIGLTPVDERKTADYEGTRFTNARVERYNNLIKAVCKKHNIPFLDMFSIMTKQRYTVLLDDGLHPNKKGYRFMHERISLFLEKNHLLSRP